MTTIDWKTQNKKCGMYYTKTKCIIQNTLPKQMYNTVFRGHIFKWKIYNTKYQEIEPLYDFERKFKGTPLTIKNTKTIKVLCLHSNFTNRQNSTSWAQKHIYWPLVVHIHPDMTNPMNRKADWNYYHRKFVMIIGMFDTKCIIQNIMYNTKSKLSNTNV